MWRYIWLFILFHLKSAIEMREFQMADGDTVSSDAEVDFEGEISKFHSFRVRNPEVMALIELQTQVPGECPRSGPLANMGCAVEGISGQNACHCGWTEICDRKGKNQIKVYTSTMTVGRCVQTWKGSIKYKPFLITVLIILGLMVSYLGYHRVRIIAEEARAKKYLAAQAKYAAFWENALVTAISPRESEQPLIQE